MLDKIDLMENILITFAYYYKTYFKKNNIPTKVFYIKYIRDTYEIWSGDLQTIKQLAETLNQKIEILEGEK